MIQRIKAWLVSAALIVLAFFVGVGVLKHMAQHPEQDSATIKSVTDKGTDATGEGVFGILRFFDSLGGDEK